MEYGTPHFGGRGGRRGSAMAPLERAMVVSYRQGCRGYEFSDPYPYPYPQILRGYPWIYPYPYAYPVYRVSPPQKKLTFIRIFAKY